MHHCFRNLLPIAILLGILSLAACSKKKTDDGNTATPPVENTPSVVGELNLLIFPEYLDEKSIRDFESQYKSRLRITVYDSSEEMESKLAYAGADSQYDVVVMAGHLLPRMVRRKLVRPLDHAQIPNLKNLESRFSGPGFDDGNKHAVPYQWGTIGLIYNKKKFPNLEQTWGVLFDPQKIVGTFELMDEMRDMLGVVLKYRGFSSNSTVPEEIREAGRVIREAKKQNRCLGFKGGVGAVEDVMGGSVDMAVAWNGDAQKKMREDKERGLAFIIPKEGSVLWVDVMSVTANAPHPELAHKFINFILEPEIGAQLSLYTKYASPNAAAQAKLPTEERTNPLSYPPPEVSDHLEHHRDLGDAAKIFDEVWTTVKSQ